MTRIHSFLALVLFIAALGGSLHAEGIEIGGPSEIGLEIENQTPCFFFGGYQLSIGMRAGNLRLRVSTQDSGGANFEETGIDSRSDAFRRSFDDGSFSASLDYFAGKHFFTYATLGSNRWLVEKKDTAATAHLRTLDAGVGLGFQYLLLKGFFIQIAAQVNFRERSSLLIEGQQYTVPGIDYSPGLRLGYRF